MKRWALPTAIEYVNTPTCVCIQLMGLPTYWRVVIIMENMSRMTLEMLQCRRNTVVVHFTTGGQNLPLLGAIF